jgi:hypothetical protein
MERADVRMRNARDSAGFLSEAFNPWIRSREQLTREELDGHDPIEPRIARSIDFTHSAGTEWCQDLERTKASAGCKSHRRG